MATRTNKVTVCMMSAINMRLFYEYSSLQTSYTREIWTSAAYSAEVLPTAAVAAILSSERHVGMRGDIKKNRNGRLDHSCYGGKLCKRARNGEEFEKFTPYGNRLELWELGAGKFWEIREIFQQITDKWVRLVMKIGSGRFPNGVHKHGKFKGGKNIPEWERIRAFQFR